MKHAGEAALDQLESLLAQIRKIEGLKEKKRGIFYLKSKAFLHFHEDPAGLFADLMGVARFNVNDAAGRKNLIQAAKNKVSI